MDFIITLLMIPILVGVLLGLWNWIVGGLADSASDFIYYSIHKHDDKD